LLCLVLFPPSPNPLGAKVETPFPFPQKPQDFGSVAALRTFFLPLNRWNVFFLLISSWISQLDSFLNTPRLPIHVDFLAKLLVSFLAWNERPLLLFLIDDDEFWRRSPRLVNAQARVVVRVPLFPTVLLTRVPLFSVLFCALRRFRAVFAQRSAVIGLSLTKIGSLVFLFGQRGGCFFPRSLSLFD